MFDDGVELRVERIYRLDSDNSLKGFADVCIAGGFVIKGLRIVDGKNGLFVGMPRELGKDGKWRNKVYLTDKALQEKLAAIVLSAYEE